MNNKEKAAEVRGAILGLYADTKSVREVMAKDIQAKWPFLNEIGLTIHSIVKIANDSNISEEHYNLLMKALRRHR
jgi:hypothetical protein